MSKQWRVQARDDGFAVLGANGDEMLVSVKEYASPATAKRAAERFAQAMAEGFLLEYEQDGEIVQEDYSPEAATAEAAAEAEPAKIVVPTPGVSVHSSDNPAYAV